MTTDRTPDPLDEYYARHLADVLTELLDDGTGDLHPDLAPLYLRLWTMPRPMRGLTWIRNNPHVAEYLQGLARGTIPLTHQGLFELSSWRTAAHLRDLLIDCDILPAIDRQILAFERWSQHQLTTHPDPAIAGPLRQFITWHQLPRMRATAEHGPLKPYARNYAAGQVTAATDFLTWLTERGRALHQTHQADLDTWHAHASHSRTKRARGFLHWAITTGHMSQHELPPLHNHNGSSISQQHRLQLLRHALTDNENPIHVRVAACLVLLYAQPVTRLVRLTTSDITSDHDHVLLHLGEPPVPVPTPFDTLLTSYLTHRNNRNTTNADSDWLFPGGRAGEPLAPNGLARQLRTFGIPTTQARTAAFQQLVLQAPAPVTAHALGYTPNTAHQHHTTAGGTWARYTETA